MVVRRGSDSDPGYGREEPWHGEYAAGRPELSVAAPNVRAVGRERRRAAVLIDCDTCTVRGQGCDDCVVTVLLGAPPGWRGSDPTVVPITRREVPEGGPAERRATGGPVRAAAGAPDVRSEDAPGLTAGDRGVDHIDTTGGDPWSVVELDEVERRAVQALADFGLVPPLRHQDASTPVDRHVS